MNVLIFDIETVPDATNGRRFYDFEGTDHEVAEQMRTHRREATGSDFMKHHMHQIVAISVVWRNTTQSQLKVASLGNINATEKILIERFFKSIDKYSPMLISWNGSGFDLPVIHYRALLHSISSQRYWETGDHDATFRWNNYLNRYHYRHLDLMEVLSAYQLKAAAPLQEIALMLGLPGKLGMDGKAVFEAYYQGQIEQIRNYCETDVLNTYLIYLRFEVMRDNLSQEVYETECQLLKHYLQHAQKTHFMAFLEQWNQNS